MLQTTVYVVVNTVYTI